MTKRILLVDDEPDIRHLARMSLEHLGGYFVTLASSGQEALDAVRRELPDAVVMDVQMPGMDGPATFRALDEAAAGNRPPVVFLTASVREADLRALHELGVAGVLTKPFDPLTLPDQVAALLGWPR